MNNMLVVQDLKKEFDQGGNKVAAVNGVNLAVRQGEFASIIGRSGSGKSTLLSLLGALDSPTSGSIVIDGQDITRLHGSALGRYRRSTIGFVFQNYNLVPNLTALENVLLPMEFARLPKKQQVARAASLLEGVGITGDAQKRKPGKMSGGEQQRVSIARALANHPKLILADEPTGNLDSENGRRVFEILHNLTRSGKATVVVVTHDLEIAGRTSRVFQLMDGKLTT